MRQTGVSSGTCTPIRTEHVKLYVQRTITLSSVEVRAISTSMCSDKLRRLCARPWMKVHVLRACVQGTVQMPAACDAVALERIAVVETIQ